jgi:uncharacterized protein
MPQNIGWCGARRGTIVARKELAMMCPRCNTAPLAEIDRSGIQIDRCPRCRGVWLDRGELEKIIAESARHDDDDDGEPRTDRRRSRDRGDDDERGGVRGFLANLFD